jgi:uncharacterized damage-inducible protein DinB
MEALMAVMVDRLEALHAQMSRALAGLPPAALDWAPGPEMNSLAVLATHTAGSERFWIGDVAGEEPSDRVRAAEFEATGVSVGSLQVLLNSALAHSQKVLQRLRLEEMGEMRRLPDGSEVSVGWALLHALEHTGVHTGHIELPRQLWDQRAAGTG